MIALAQFKGSFVVTSTPKYGVSSAEEKKTSHRYKNDSVPEITDAGTWLK
jgi:hypothetical protein